MFQTFSHLNCFFLLFVCLFTASCSTSAPKTYEIEKKAKLQRNFRVSVRSDGESISNFTKSLVHRVSVDSAQLRDLYRAQPPGLNIPFVIVAESDSFDRPVGLRLEAAPNASAPSDLGLRHGDIITAVEKKHTVVEEDLMYLFDQLDINRRATLTLLRDGDHHKFFYSVK